MRATWLTPFAALLLLWGCSSEPTAPPPAAGGAGPVPGTQQDLEVNVGDRVFFAFDSSELSPEAQGTLQRQAAWLKQYGNVRVQIEGHCDERGTREYNLALGARRANAVQRYLASLGVPASRMTTISYGKEYPADPRSTEDAWAKNRRAVTVVRSGAGA